MSDFYNQFTAHRDSDAVDSPEATMAAPAGSGVYGFSADLSESNAGVAPKDLVLDSQNDEEPVDRPARVLLSPLFVNDDSSSSLSSADEGDGADDLEILEAQSTKKPVRTKKVILSFSSPKVQKKSIVQTRSAAAAKARPAQKKKKTPKVSKKSLAKVAKAALEESQEETPVAEEVDEDIPEDTQQIAPVVTPPSRPSKKGATWKKPGQYWPAEYRALMPRSPRAPSVDDFSKVYHDIEWLSESALNYRKSLPDDRTLSAMCGRCAFHIGTEDFAPCNIKWSSDRIVKTICDRCKVNNKQCNNIDPALISGFHDVLALRVFLHHGVSENIIADAVKVYQHEHKVRSQHAKALEGSAASVTPGKRKRSIVLPAVVEEDTEEPSSKKIVRALRLHAELMAIGLRGHNKKADADSAKILGLLKELDDGKPL